MTLTVPTGGVSAGRSANTAVNEPGALGAGLADLGQAMLQVGKRVKAERDDIDMRRTQLQMTRDMGQARLHGGQSVGKHIHRNPDSHVQARFIDCCLVDAVGVHA